MIDGEDECENETENDDDGSTDRATHKSIEEQILSNLVVFFKTLTGLQATVILVVYSPTIIKQQRYWTAR